MDEISLDQFKETELLSWLRSRAGDGYNCLKEDPVWPQVSRNIDYVDGRQMVNRKEGRSILVDNRVRRALFTTVSSMTDVRPIWDYETTNSVYKPQSEILNKLAKAWWKDTCADRPLQEALKYAGVGGSGYVYVSWNPELQGGGNLELLALDTRDVIPMGHPTYGGSIQEWKGVLVRQRKPLSWLKERYPHKSYALKASGSWFEDDLRGKPARQRVYSTVLNVLKSGMIDGNSSGDTLTDYMRVFIKDSSIHRGEAPVRMGRGNWAYTVYPVGMFNPVTGHETTEEEARLWPGGRLIVCTPAAILDDIPNPYWHGMFPIVKLCLDPTPWSLLGISMVSELVGLQDDLNSALRGLSDNIKQHIKRAIVSDKMAMDKGQLDMMDTSDPGWRVRVNPAMGDGFKIIDPAVLPSYYMDYIGFLKAEIDDAAGIKDLEQLAALKQLPSADTVQQFMEAMTPILRLRERVMEQSLGEIAELMKVNFFQFYDLPRRIRLLGPSGVTQQDVLDYSPEQMVPSLKKGDPGYLPELDSSLSPVERARSHHRNFHFHIAPNSFLNVTHVQKKMFALQLYRQGVLDIWSLWQAMDVPNTGPEPAVPVPERMKLMIKDLGMIPGTPMNPQLMAALQGGGGMPMPPPEGGGGGGAPSGKPQGRPPSGAEPPKLETRMSETGPRQLVSESG